MPHDEGRCEAQIDAIAATPGIDVLFIGTSDLSFSLGLRGAQDDPRLDEAVAKIAAAGKKYGKFMGRPRATRSSTISNASTSRSRPASSGGR